MFFSSSLLPLYRCDLTFFLSSPKFFLCKCLRLPTLIGALLASACFLWSGTSSVRPASSLLLCFAPCRADDVRDLIPLATYSQHRKRFRSGPTSGPWTVFRIVSGSFEASVLRGGVLVAHVTDVEGPHVVGGKVATAVRKPLRVCSTGPRAFGLKLT